MTNAKPNWLQPHHAKQLAAMPTELAVRWAQGLAPEQLVTVEWHNFWKGLNK